MSSEALDRKQILRFWQRMPEGPGRSDARRQVAHLGVKGAGLVRLCELGLPVPDGFIIPTTATDEFMERNALVISEAQRRDWPPNEIISELVLPEQLWSSVKEGIRWLEERSDRGFGSADRPLLVSVRSGGTVSLPGLMETVCNVGLTADMLQWLNGQEGKQGFLIDCFRRFVEGYASAVCCINRRRFRSALCDGQQPVGRGEDLVAKSLSLCKIPDGPWEALRDCVIGVMLSAYTKDVCDFIRTNYIRDPVKTGVIIQRMVFGNLDANSGSGVAFSRDPSTGRSSENEQGAEPFGQVFMGSQGVDIVQDLGEPGAVKELASIQPNVLNQLKEIACLLERDSGYVQDIEFTIESGELYLLQARPAKMAPAAFLKAQLDMIEEGIATRGDVIARTDPRQLESALSSTLMSRQGESLKLIGRGSPLAPGYATGRICFDIANVRRYKSKNEPVIFCCQSLALPDIPALQIVDGIISSQRNVLSHATLNARYLGRPSLVKASLRIDPASGTIRYGGDKMAPGVLREGDTVSIDAHEGQIYEGRIETSVSGIEDPLIQRFCELLTSYGDMRVYAQAEDRDTYAAAKRLGADGVASFRSDVLLFEKANNFALCDYVLSMGTEDEASTRSRLMTFLQAEYSRIFRSIDEDHIAIRLCKHTMYEYFPKERLDVIALAEYVLRSRQPASPEGRHSPLPPRQVERMVRKIRAQKRSLEDYNPFLARRGVRLATTLPQIYEVEIESILRAMLESRAEGKEMRVELLVPYISVVGELIHVRNLTDRIAVRCDGADLRYDVAPVVEMSGIAFDMDKIACHTNLVVIRSDKLTASTHHLVREDAREFLGEYVGRGWFFGDPFRVIQESTERIVSHAVRAAKQVNPSIRIQVAGTHCANEYSLGRLLALGITEVCCPPMMVPVAKLIAAKIKKARLDETN